MFRPPGSQAILVFQLQTAWQYSDGNPSNGGVEQRCPLFFFLHRAKRTNSFPPLSSLSPPSPSLPPRPYLLEVGPLNTARGSEGALIG